MVKVGVGVGTIEVVRLGSGAGRLTAIVGDTLVW